MTTLQHTYRKNSYTYVRIMRNEHAAIYAQMDKDRLVGYEVGRVKIQQPGQIGDNKIEGGEVFWANEDFGRIAWSIRQKVRAMERYWEVTRTAIEEADRKSNEA